MAFRIQALVPRICESLLYVMWECSHNCPFGDLVRVAGKFERSQDTDNRDRVHRVEEVRFYLQLHRVQQLDNISGHRTVAFWGTMYKSVCSMLDCSGIMFLHRFMYGKMLFIYFHFADLMFQLKSC